MGFRCSFECVVLYSRLFFVFYSLLLLFFYYVGQLKEVYKMREDAVGLTSGIFFQCRC